MKIRHLVLAASAAVLLAPGAYAATTATKGEDCAALQQKFDKEITTHATAAGAAKAKEMRAEGEKLCKDGKTAEGEKKLHEALKELKGK
jgi:hypothetical protein